MLLSHEVHDLQPVFRSCERMLAKSWQIEKAKAELKVLVENRRILEGLKSGFTHVAICKFQMADGFLECESVYFQTTETFNDKVLDVIVDGKSIRLDDKAALAAI